MLHKQSGSLLRHLIQNLEEQFNERCGLLGKVLCEHSQRLPTPCVRMLRRMGASNWAANQRTCASYAA